MSPTVFKAKGYRFYFLSNEERRIHVHVTGGSGEAKFWLEPVISLAVNYGVNKRDLHKVQVIIEERRDEILEAWHAHFGKS